MFCWVFAVVVVVVGHSSFCPRLTRIRTQLITRRKPRSTGDSVRDGDNEMSRRLFVLDQSNSNGLSFCLFGPTLPSSKEKIDPLHNGRCQHVCAHLELVFIVKLRYDLSFTYWFIFLSSLFDMPTVCVSSNPLTNEFLPSCLLRQRTSEHTHTLHTVFPSRLYVPLW